MVRTRLGGADFQHLKACHSLQWLDLWYADISSGVFETLPPFPRLETVVQYTFAINAAWQTAAV